MKTEHRIVNDLSQIEISGNKTLGFVIVRVDLQWVSYLSSLPNQLYMCFADRGLNKNSVPGMVLRLFWRGYS
jgi:hypothetical protein